MRKHRTCKFCQRTSKTIDYKDVGLLTQFISSRGKILGRRLTHTCAKHQRSLTKAIKRARTMALMPFLVR